ncbi:hypothetical protein QN239_23465 [Mycolicibacterium sp. Y3]
MIAKALAVAAVTSGVAVLSAGISSANPPAFPDLSGYTPVDIADYRIDTTTPGHSSSGTYFATPDGVICNFSSLQPQCRGNNFPAVPPAASDPARGLNRANWIGTVTGLKQTNEGTPTNTFNGQAIKTLPPLHSITVGGAVCGVDDHGTTACKDSQGRGFILSPEWSGWLPKV